MTKFEVLLQPNVTASVHIPPGRDPIEYITDKFWRVESNYYEENWHIYPIRKKPAPADQKQSAVKRKRIPWQNIPAWEKFRV